MAIRVVEKQEALYRQVLIILARAGFSPVEIGETKDGRIASNLIVKTKQGPLLVRAYPKEMTEKLETGNPLFEIAALEFTQSKGLAVPNLITFDNGKKFIECENLIVSAYPFIAGYPVSKDNLNPEIAHKAGIFAASLIEVAHEFPHDPSEKIVHEFDFIQSIFEKRSKIFPELLTNSVAQEMLFHTQNTSLRQAFSATPLGLVHADFFFENFIITPNHEALIDFGDAYYGHILTDVCLAAMEFAANNEEAWNFDSLRAFFLPIAPWLIKNSIFPSLIVDVMEILCAKFLVYTIPFTKANGQLIEQNPYHQRYLYLRRPEIRSFIMSEISLVYDN